MHAFKPMCFFLLSLVAFSVNAETDDVVPEWSSICSKNTGLSAVIFKSKSGDVTEDDFIVELRWLGGNKTILKIPEAWYLSKPSLSLPSNACSGIGALAFSNKLLLILPSNGRPGWDRVSAVLIDTKNQSVLDIRADFGEITDEYKHQASGNTFSLYLFKEWVAGKNGGEEGVPAWYDLKIIDEKITGSWRK